MNNGILEDKLALISSRSMGLVTCMGNPMVDEITIFLIGGLGVFTRLYVLTLCFVEKNDTRRFFATLPLVDPQIKKMRTYSNG